MRNIRKKLIVKEVKVMAYDTVEKVEKILIGIVSEVEKGIELPENYVLISEEVVSEKKVVYKMTPLEFVKHATIEE